MHKAVTRSALKPMNEWIYIDDGINKESAKVVSIIPGKRVNHLN